ncbi:hypothetical protein ACFL6E_00690 [Candidatus Neomarinimicrobiota bacterium]
MITSSRFSHILIGISLLAALTGCGKKEQPTFMNNAAESYVKLVLAMGTHDAGYVDAYYGPQAWRTAVESEAKGLDQIIQEATALQQELRAAATPSDQMDKLRKDYLTTQLGALIAFGEQKNGKRFSFDEESWALYNAVAPHYDIPHYEAILTELNSLVPGTGDLSTRVNDFRAQFDIPAEKVDQVFVAAIDEARRRTLKQIELPADESFRIEYVNDKPWGAYNWYQGSGQSLIQVNTDLPMNIDRAVDLAAHEGYPGHHVYNALLEQHMVDERGWIEFSVYPLQSPQSLIAEGTANFGVEVAFPGTDRIRFEKEVLFPIAGLDTSQAELFYAISELKDKLSYADNEAARGYLDGTMTADEAVNFMVKHSLMSPERARKRLSFFEVYRSYIINYSYGQDLVRNYINDLGGTADNPQRRWELFMELISSPRLPAGLKLD